MKKICIIFSIIFMSIVGIVNANEKKTFGDKTTDAVATVYEDGKTAVATVYDDGKDLIKSAYPEVKEAIIAIAGAIGVAAEHVYTVLVKRYVVEGVSYLLWFIIGIVFAIISLKSFHKYSNENSVITWKILFPIVYAIIAVITLSTINYTDMLMGIINPEYGAINYIIDYTKAMIH